MYRPLKLIENCEIFEKAQNFIEQFQEVYTLKLLINTGCCGSVTTANYCVLIVSDATVTTANHRLTNSLVETNNSRFSRSESTLAKTGTYIHLISTP